MQTRVLGRLVVVALSLGLGCETTFKLPTELVIRCAETPDCPEGYHCVLDEDVQQGICSNPSRPFCGNGVRDVEEFCDNGATNSDAYSSEAQRCNAACSGYRRYCGDGDRTDDEVCDNGGLNSDDYNSNSAQPQSCNTGCNGYRDYCGDGIKQPNEECDDGSDNGDTYTGLKHCNGSCTGHYDGYCGDGVLNSNYGETCDDENDITTDACPSGPSGTCIFAWCGDGFRYHDEEGCESGETRSCSTGHEMFLSGEAVCNSNCLLDYSVCQIDPSQMADGMILVPEGLFWMGCNEAVDDSCQSNEVPYHQVSLDAFYIEQYEVTAGQYTECVEAGACAYTGITTDTQGTYNHPDGRDNYPINYVSWGEAATYCEWKRKRLPTEAEWEKAARGTDGQKYPWGNESPTCDYAVIEDGCGTSQTWPVGSKPNGASPYGAMDMSGNVSEWVNDWWLFENTYSGELPVVDPHGPESTGFRGIRGGSYYNSIEGMRSSDRPGDVPSNQSPGYGFRCAYLATKRSTGGLCVSGVDCVSGLCVKVGNNSSGLCGE